MSTGAAIRYAVDLPTFGDYSNPRTLAEMAHEAEQAGWDGFFVWDHILGEKNPQLAVGDPWIALAAIAVRTEFIRFGPLVTPLPRRRPWKVARETVSLDHLSGGRLILGVGLGYPPDADFETFGEDADDQVRARKLDEGLQVITGLWSGQPFSHRGDFYKVSDVQFLPPPVQSPRVPIWVAGLWPNKAPFRRAARWDGVVPMKVGIGLEMMLPDDVRGIVAYIRQQRPSTNPFDVVVGGYTQGDDRARDAEIVAPYAEAGLTWWLEHLHGWRGSFQEMRQRIRQGPPKPQ